MAEKRSQNFLGHLRPWLPDLQGRANTEVDKEMILGCTTFLRILKIHLNLSLQSSKELYHPQSCRLESYCTPFFYFKAYLFIYLFVYSPLSPLCVCVCSCACVCAHASVCQDLVQSARMEYVLSFPNVGRMDYAQVLRLGSNCLYPVSHHVGLVFLSIAVQLITPKCSGLQEHRCDLIASVSQESWLSSAEPSADAALQSRLMQLSSPGVREVLTPGCTGERSTVFPFVLLKIDFFIT